jgi:hypothetical protein
VFFSHHPQIPHEKQQTATLETLSLGLEPKTKQKLDPIFVSTHPPNHFTIVSKDNLFFVYFNDKLPLTIIKVTLHF